MYLVILNWLKELVIDSSYLKKDWLTKFFSCIMGTRHTLDDESMTNSLGQFKMTKYMFPGTVR